MAQTNILVFDARREDQQRNDNAKIGNRQLPHSNPLRTASVVELQGSEKLGHAVGRRDVLSKLPCRAPVTAQGRFSID
jgi:hypothetical protein